LCRGRIRLGNGQHNGRGRNDRPEDEHAAHDPDHVQRPHSVASGSSGVVASAKSVTVQIPAAAAQLAAKVHGELPVFWIVVLPPVSVMMAVSPG